jgi:hypothetical protein
VWYTHLCKRKGWVVLLSWENHPKPHGPLPASNHERRRRPVPPWHGSVPVGSSFRRDLQAAIALPWAFSIHASHRYLGLQRLTWFLVKRFTLEYPRFRHTARRYFHSLRKGAAHPFPRLDWNGHRSRFGFYTSLIRLSVLRVPIIFE